MTKTLLLASLLALAGTNANAEKIQINVKSSDGATGIDGVQVQYVTSQFYNVGTTANGGQIATTDFPTLTANTKYRLRLTYKGTTVTTDQFTATSNLNIHLGEIQSCRKAPIQEYQLVTFKTRCVS